jgi:hypothetical protein
MNLQKQTYFTLRTQRDLEGNRESVNPVLNSTKGRRISNKNAIRNNFYLIYFSVYNTTVGMNEILPGFYGYSRG